MKAVIIDDNSLIKADHLGIDKEDLYRVGLKTSTRETAEAAIDCLKKLSGDDGIIFINLDLKLEKEYRQYLKGIEILTWLRVNRVVNHCVLYSFRPIDYIGSRKQQNLIIFAEGASFLQLPFNRRALDLESLAKKTVLTENLKSYLRASFRIGEFRHRDANWWAIKQLLDMHTIATMGTFMGGYPGAVQSELAQLNNSVAAFLFKVADEELNAALKSLESPRPGNSKLVLRSLDHIKADLLTKSAVLREKLATFAPAMECWNKVKSRTAINKKRVLVIDDMADRGWMELYLSVFGQWLEFLEPVIPSKLDSIEQIWDIVKERISKDRPELVLLDLRLQDEVGSFTDQSKLSGADILQRIRDSFSVPILLTTASNKQSAFTAVTRLGADAYFKKVGLDEHNPSEAIASNYQELIDSVLTLTGIEYEILQDMYAFAQSFREEIVPRWSGRVWLNGDPIVPDFDQIERVLKDSCILLRSYLHNFVLGYGYGTDLDRAFIQSALITKIAGVFELVHGREAIAKPYRDYTELREKKWVDVNMGRIKEHRNTHAHAPRSPVSWNEFRTIFKDVKEYLENPYEIVTLSIESAKSESGALYIKLSNGFVISRGYVFDLEHDLTDILRDCDIRYPKSFFKNQFAVEWLNADDLQTVFDRLSGLTYESNWRARIAFDSSCELGTEVLAVKIANDNVEHLLEFPLEKLPKKLLSNLDLLKENAAQLSVVRGSDGEFTFEGYHQIIDELKRQ